MNTQTKKITLATIKSFIKKNYDSLFIQVKSDFSGYTDCLEFIKNPSFVPVTINEDEHPNMVSHTYGIDGAWFVGSSKDGSSRDYFKSYEDESYIGYYIYNCCGSFTLAIKK